MRVLWTEKKNNEEILRSANYKIKMVI